MANNHLDIIIGENAAPVEVKIKVEARQVGYFRSFPLHHSQEELKSEAEKRGYKNRLLPNGNLVVWIDDISVEFIQDDSRRCFKIREFEYVGCGINADAVQVYDFIEKYCLYKKVLLSVIDLGFDISVSECAERAHLYQQTCAGKDIK
jgi:hypothetical protein